MNDPAFKNIGKKPGLEIWRVDKTKVVLVTDLTKYGRFLANGSYIVLLSDKTSTGWKYDIHFWLGAQVTPEEMAAAAVKTAEVAECLGGLPIQHREVQGHESQQFQNLFKPYGGLRYASESSGKKAESEAEKRLLHVKGKRTIRVLQEPVSVDSLHKGGVFILDTGAKIFQWNGEKSKRSEKAKALEVVKQIRDNERGGKIPIAVIDDGKDDDAEFFTQLGGKGAVKDAPVNDAPEVKKVTENTLYRITEASGPLKMEEIGSGVLRREQLETSDAFIVDTSQQLFIWMGKKGTRLEKVGAWTIAQKFMAEKGYPAWIPCTRIAEGGETALFIQQFAGWPKPEASPNFAKSGNIARIVKKDVDVSKVQIQEKPERQQYIDDGSGKLEIWRVDRFEKVMVSIREVGQFYQENSYVLLYTYKDKYARENFVIYFWQGLDSSKEEKEAASLLAIELEHEYSSVPVLVRVVQGKEPDHFLSVFRGQFIVHRGSHAAGYRSSFDGSALAGGFKMYQIRGTSPLNTKTIEVEAKATSLNSNECFVVLTDEVTLVWFGKYSTGDERAVAKTVADSLARVTKVENVFEGSEPDLFWAALSSGKEEYNNKQVEVVPEFEPRLFQCSNAGGNFTLEEIFDFTQEDLISEDVMLLDAWSEVYLWVGNGAPSSERNLVLETLTKYLHYAPGGRSPETTPIAVLKQGYEPNLFTCHFIWDEKRARTGIDNYETLKAQIVTKATQSSAPPAASAQKDLAKLTKVFPYEVLLRRPLPEGVDSKNLENHLNPADFKRILGCTEAEFRAMPTWKKEAKKKDAKLF